MIFRLISEVFHSLPLQSRCNLASILAAGGICRPKISYLGGNIFHGGKKRRGSVLGFYERNILGTEGRRGLSRSRGLEETFNVPDGAEGGCAQRMPSTLV